MADRTEDRGARDGAREGVSAETSTSTTRFIDARRRGFLQGAAVAGGVAASGVSLADHDHGVEPAAPSDAAPASGGYRETDHVREYYAKARF